MSLIKYSTGKLLPLLIPLLVFVCQTHAQPYLEVASAQIYKFSPSGIREGENIRNTSSDWFTASLSIPWKMDSSDILLFSPGFEYRTITEPESQSEFYRTLNFPLTWIHNIRNSKYKFSLTGIYRFNGDTRLKFDNHTDQMGGAFILYRKQSENLTYKAGIYYNREFFGDLWIPFLGIDARISERFYIWALLPRSLMADFMIIPSLHTGIAFRGVQESYRLRRNEVFDYFMPNEGYLRLYFDYYIPKTIFVLSAGAGHTLQRRYYYGNDQHEIETLPDGGFILSAGLSMRIVTDKRFATQR